MLVLNDGKDDILDCVRCIVVGNLVKLINTKDHTSVTLLMPREDIRAGAFANFVINAKIYESSNDFKDFATREEFVGLSAKEVKKQYEYDMKCLKLLEKLFPTDEERSEVKGRI